MDVYPEAVLLKVGIASLLALGYWVSASTGRFSFGHAGFMAIGAYAGSIATLKMGWPLVVALPAAGVMAAVAGAVVGWIALRLSMLYLAIFTFVFAELVHLVLAEWSYVGGASGLAGMSGATLPLVYGCLALVAGFLILLTRSRKGLALESIREDRQAARACGVQVTAVSVQAFAISAFLTGVGGTLLAHQTLFISPAQFGGGQSLLLILFVVLGGIDHFWGAIVGAVVLTLLPIWFEFLQDYYQILNGLLFVVLMVVRPQGLIGRARGDRGWRTFLRRRPQDTA